MNVVITGDLFAFPHGMAATSRVHAIARGLRQNGADVAVLSLKRSDGTSRSPYGNYDPHGVSLGDVVYGYPLQRQEAIGPATLWRRLEVKVRSRIGRPPSGRTPNGMPVRQLLTASANDAFSGETIDGIIVYTRRADLLEEVTAAARRLGAVVLLESTEALVPPRIHEPEIDRYTRMAVRRCDGIDAVSEHLGSWWVEHGLPLARLTVGQGIVDLAPFESDTGSIDVNDRTITYVGNLTSQEAVRVISVYASVRREVPQAVLQMLGGTGDSRRDADVRAALSERASDLGCSEGVEFRGRVSRDELISALRSSTVLLLPRDVDEFTQAAFPNKLAEYLASGRPVVATAVGDIPRVLEDRKTAYLVPPHDEAAIAGAVVRALSCTEEADAVGREGRLLAMSVFDCRVGGARLIRHIESLRGRRGPLRRITHR